MDNRLLVGLSRLRPCPGLGQSLGATPLTLLLVYPLVLAVWVQLLEAPHNDPTSRLARTRKQDRRRHDESANDETEGARRHTAHATPTRAAGEVMTETTISVVDTGPLDQEFVDAIRQGFDNLLSPAIRGLDTIEYNHLLDELVWVVLRRREES